MKLVERITRSSKSAAPMGRPSILLFLVCVVLTMSVAVPVAAAPTVRLVVSERSDVYSRIAQSISERVLATGRPIRIETLSAAEMSQRTSSVDLTVTIGTKAAASIGRPKIDGDIISVLISRSASAHLQKNRQSSTSQSISVVTLEQNITRFLR